MQLKKTTVVMFFFLSLFLILTELDGVNAKAKPGGSYQKTCRNCSFSKGILECECRKINGRWQRTRINVNKCRGSISNQNGVLRCD